MSGWCDAWAIKSSNRIATATPAKILGSRLLTSAATSCEVRLYDSVIQNYNDVPQLAGLEEDLALKQEMELKIVYCKANKCYYIALTYMSSQKWAETRALFQRANAYANKVKNDSLLPDAMKKEMQALMQLIESKQFMAHANSILEAEGGTAPSDDVKVKVDPKKAAIPLLNRLDDYYEDPELTSGKPNLAPFPPAFEPIPCKPLFFDLAREHVEFPDLEGKISGPSGSNPQGASGGWLGGWLGGWGKK